MEVSGQKVSTGQYDLKCKTCEENESSTPADGYCGECEEYMCKTCFDTHKKFKLNKGHILADPIETVVKNGQTEDLEKCDQHFKEMIKFYCTNHEQVGCGDCMVFDHKTCKVEYIHDKARTFKDSKEFNDLVKSAEKCHAETKKLLSSIKDNKVLVVDINEKFNQDVNMLKDEIMSHVTKMANTMLRQGRDVMEMDMERMNALEKDIEGMINELSLLTEEFESQIDRPSKLFVNSVLQKPILKRLREQIDSMKGKNKIDMYEFKREDNLERLVKECKELGSILRMKQRTEMDLQQQQEVRPKKTQQIVQASPKAQPLIERQLICRNITVDGEYLSYLENGSGDVGLYVEKEEMKPLLNSFFEVELIKIGKRGTIAIGLVPPGYPEKCLPGRGEYSFGFDAQDGKLYYESDTGKKFGPKCNVGDRIGCGLIEKWIAVFFASTKLKHEGLPAKRISELWRSEVAGITGKSPPSPFKRQKKLTTKASDVKEHVPVMEAKTDQDINPGPKEDTYLSIALVEYNQGRVYYVLRDPDDTNKEIYFKAPIGYIKYGLFCHKRTKLSFVLNQKDVQSGDKKIIICDFTGVIEDSVIRVNMMSISPQEQVLLISDYVK